MEFKQVSLNASMLYFENSISEEVLNQVQHAFLSLKNLEGITDITPSYTSLLIEYDASSHTHRSLEKQIKKVVTETPSNMTIQQKHIKIPIDNTKGEDLETVAKYHDLTIEEVVGLHSSTTYRVYAIGFMVGLAYLGTLSPKLFTPRRSTPRAKVPKGAVGIADHQTAIYPQQSAGGWNIIGHTDFDDFASFSIGDSVVFVRI